MKIYVAATYANKEEARAFAQTLDLQGHVVTSSWLWREENEAQPPTPEAAISYADQDLIDIDHAEALIIMLGPTPTGGKWVEFGYVLGTGKEVYYTGDGAMNVFTYLANRWQ